MGNQSLADIYDAAERQYRDGKFSEALSTCEKAAANGLESADLAAVHSKSYGNYFGALYRLAFYCIPGFILFITNRVVDLIGNSTNGYGI